MESSHLVNQGVDLVSQGVELEPTLVLEVLDHPVAQGALLRRYEHRPYEDHDYLFATVEASQGPVGAVVMLQEASLGPVGVVVKLQDRPPTTSCFR